MLSFLYWSTEHPFFFLHPMHLAVLYRKVVRDPSKQTVLRQANKVTNTCLHAPISRVCRGICANHATLAKESGAHCLIDPAERQTGHAWKMTYSGSNTLNLLFKHLSAQMHMLNFLKLRIFSCTSGQKQCIAAEAMRTVRHAGDWAFSTNIHTVSLVLPTFAFCGLV